MNRVSEKYPDLSTRDKIMFDGAITELKEKYILKDVDYSETVKFYDHEDDLYIYQIFLKI